MSVCLFPQLLVEDIDYVCLSVSQATSGVYRLCLFVCFPSY